MFARNAWELRPGQQPLVCYKL